MAGKNTSEPPKSPIIGLAVSRRGHSYNPFEVVGTKKTKATPAPSQKMIRLTEELAESAKRGTLRGMAYCTDYEPDGYHFGLEGTYKDNPGEAVLPLERLKKRILEQVEQED